LVVSFVWFAGFFLVLVDSNLRMKGPARIQAGFGGAGAGGKPARRIAGAIPDGTARAGVEAGLVFITFGCGIFLFLRPERPKTL
jgi:hypothetical protein